MVDEIARNEAGVYVVVYTPSMPRKIRAYKQLITLGAVRTTIANCWTIRYPTRSVRELLAMLEWKFGKNSVLVFEVYQ
jgi:hypothetical protein